MTGSERGSGSVVIIGLVALLFVISAMGAAVAKVVAASHRADSAADLAALSAASTLRPGLVDGVSATVQSLCSGFPRGCGRWPVLAGTSGGDACSIGAEVANDHGAELRTCRVDSGAVDLEVAVVVLLPMVGYELEVHARARAGVW